MIVIQNSSESLLSFLRASVILGVITGAAVCGKGRAFTIYPSFGGITNLRNE